MAVTLMTAPLLDAPAVIAVTVKSEPVSISVSLVSMPDALTVRIASSVIAPVSSTATGVSLMPVTVMVTVAVEPTLC